jgi:electron transport complex protein RnfD
MTKKDYSWMTKNKLMTYTFIALVVLTGVSAISWWPTSIIISAIAVGIAVALDFAVSLVMKARSPRDTMSAAVFGLIVALSYSLGQPKSHNFEVLPLLAPDAYYFVAVISAFGMVLLKKGQSLLGRKYVNPAAAAKFLVIFPFLNTIFLAKDHFANSVPGGFWIPSLAGPIGYSGSTSFAFYVQSCFANSINFTPSDVFYSLIVQKLHGWVGGASSLAVIIVGVVFFVLCRQYIKWRITVTYFGSVALMSLIFTGIFGGDALLRVGFELFIGSSIFLAFFMATDPATTPLTYRGQGIFGVGLGVLTVLIQTFMNFFGGSILALPIMNLTSPLLDRIGLRKPMQEARTVKLPRSQQFESATTRACIRCGECMVSCCHNLSPILIKEAFDKGKTKRLEELRADFCTGCGNCNYVCPSRIDLKGSVLRAKVSLRPKQ